MLCYRIPPPYRVGRFITLHDLQVDQPSLDTFTVSVGLGCLPILVVQRLPFTIMANRERGFGMAQDLNVGGWPSMVSVVVI